MLDISIKSITKMTDSEWMRFKESEWWIEEKYDGTKLTLVRNEKSFNPDDYTDNWIVSYKGNIIYPCEAHNADEKQIENSIGVSQYVLVHRHLKKVHFRTGSIQPLTEFFIEFMMKKPTLTREYTDKHFMKFLAYSPTSYHIRGNMIETKPEGYSTFLNKHYSYLLDIPETMKFGVLVRSNNNIKINVTKKEFVDTLCLMVRDMKSKHGGPVEGIVLKNQEGKMWKVLQEDQHDKAARLKIKMKYKHEDRDLENQYWKNINSVCDKLQDNLKKLDFEQSLLEASNQIYFGVWNGVLPNHSKRNEYIRRDDLFLTFKIRQAQRLNGNNWAAFIGKFRVFTKAHYQIIADALTKYDGVVIGIVTGKGQVIPKAFREEIITKCFPKNLEIVHLQSGNLVNVFRRAKNNINAVLCGSDRVESYKNQIKNNYNVELVEIPRNELSISASKVIKGITENGFIAYHEGVPQEISGRIYFDYYKKHFEEWGLR